MYVVLAGLIAILGAFVRYGFEWARISITTVVFFAAVTAFVGFKVGQPDLFTVVSALIMGLFVALMVPLWHPATTAYLHQPLGHGPVEDPATR